MHYRNGREAKNGDKIVMLGGYGDGAQPLAIGILYDAVPGNNHCNGSIAPTQSPTQGSSAADGASNRNFPASSAGTSPLSARIRYPPRSTAVTRAICSPGCGGTSAWASNHGSNPNSRKFTFVFSPTSEGRGQRTLWRVRRNPRLCRKCLAGAPRVTVGGL